LERDGVHYVQLPWLRITSETPIAVNVDGEPSALERLEYGVRPGALRAHVGRLPGPEVVAPDVGAVRTE
jgi:diacylglycerol kinase family enzyme